MDEYVGFFHLLKQRLRETWTTTLENERESNFRSRVKVSLEHLKEETFRRITQNSSVNQEDFSHISRPKTRSELARISCAVMGIEFSYAAETAFVSPLLLNLGLRHRHMTLIWILSPLLGLFITPILGSLSDGCTSQIGRRRPFILLLSVGIILGLILVPNGETIGHWLGDDYNSIQSGNNLELDEMNLTKITTNTTTNTNQVSLSTNHHPWGLFITILGTVLLDFDADACQSPSRAYMLDVTVPEDHAKGLSTFTIMAGLGGSFGYFLGALNWENTFLGDMFGGHVRAVFTLVLFLFIGCVYTTVRSFKEIPLVTTTTATLPKLNHGDGYLKLDDEELPKRYGTLQETSFTDNNPASSLCHIDLKTEVQPTFHDYIRTIIRLPRSLQWLCITNFFSWISLVCYSLYFTDFVGEAVFHGDPASPRGSESRELYEDGVRFACWGMSLYSLSCSIYSIFIDSLIRIFGARRVYFYGQLVYALGMVCMGLSSHPFGVIIFSWTAGIMYGTLFTIPYFLVARYHASETFDVDIIMEGEEKKSEVRGLGTDIALVSSMIFLAQITQALFLGNIVTLAGSTSVVVYSAAILATCGALASTKVLYLDI